MNAHEKLDSSRPAALGYRWPAEWEWHEASWINWPSFTTTPSKTAAATATANSAASIDAIKETCWQMLSVLAESEQVRVLVASDASAREVESRATCLGHIERKNVNIDRVSCGRIGIRNSAPMFLQAAGNAEPALVDWLARDRNRPVRADATDVAELIGAKRFNPGLVLQGGNVEGNGQGIVLCNLSRLLNTRYNPTMDESIVQRYLRNYLAAKQMLWLTGGGDSSDGDTGCWNEAPVEQLARFVDATTVVHSRCDPLPRHWPKCGLEFIRLPQAETRASAGFPVSYCSFYVANEVVFVPSYDEPKDNVALSELNNIFSTRRVVQVDARHLASCDLSLRGMVKEQCSLSR